MEKNFAYSMGWAAYIEYLVTGLIQNPFKRERKEYKIWNDGWIKASQSWPLQYEEFVIFTKTL